MWTYYGNLQNNYSYIFCYIVITDANGRTVIVTELVIN